MNRWIRFYFENCEFISFDLAAIKWIELGKLKKIGKGERHSYATNRSSVIILDGNYDKEEYCFNSHRNDEEKTTQMERTCCWNDIVCIDMWDIAHVQEFSFPWVGTDYNDYSNQLQRGKKMEDGNFLLVLKGNDIEMTTSEFLDDCEKQWLKEGSISVNRCKPKKRGLCRSYYNRDVPFEMLKYPKKKDYAIYAQRVIEYYNSIDKETGERVGKIKREFEYYTLTKEQQKKEDKKSRDYLNLSVNWDKLALPRNNDEYQLWRFRHELYSFNFNNNDYGVEVDYPSYF